MQPNRPLPCARWPWHGCTTVEQPLSVTEVPYTWSFFPSLSPGNLCHVAMMHGNPGIDLSRPFRYLELGCGNALCVSTFASCFPHAEFHGVDLNPDHIDLARKIADAGALGNLTLHQATFGEFLESSGPSFDFITLHGVFSWVPPEVREQLRTILRTRLAPGGIAYITYNAMPGWAPLLPLRTIMLEYTESRRELPLLERVSAALAYLKYLRDNQADYFRDNPSASRELDKLLQDDPRYLAHEFFAPHWSASYFSEVHEFMASCGLTFAGTSPILTNIDSLNVPERFHKVLDTAPDRPTRQIHRAFVINESFRRDVYVRPPLERCSLPLRQLWGSTLFGPTVRADQVCFDLRCPVGAVSLADPIYPVIVRLIGDKTMPFSELCSHPDLADWNDEAIVRALHMLCASGQFSMFATAMRKIRPCERLRLSAFNRLLLEERIGKESSAHLACPVLGTGLALSHYEMLMTLALDQAGPERMLDWACDFLECNGHSLKINGQPAADRSARLAVLESRLPEFAERTLPRFVELGILEAEC